MGEPYRVLVTGSRTWEDRAEVYGALDEIAAECADRTIVVVHGACPSGADAYARQWVRLFDFDGNVMEEPHPAEWSTGKSAGYRRNAQMVARGADLCLAFILDASKGATHCADLAERAGIPVRRYERSSRG